MRGAEPRATGDAPAVRWSFPWRNARAHRVREAKRDQGQPIEIPEFRVQKTGDNRSGSRKQEITGRIRRIGNYFRHQRGSGTNEASMWVHGMFLSRAAAWARVKRARHPQTERPPVWGDPRRSLDRTP